MVNRIIDWLKKSGVTRYRYNDAGMLLDSEEIIDSLNPLDDVIEHPEYPMARIYRESVWTGIVDTYHVLVGKHYGETGRKGVLDLLIFPVIGRRLISFSFDDAPLQGPLYALQAVAGLVGFVLEVSRHLLGVSLTVALTPAVAAVHFFTYFKAKDLREKIETLRPKKQWCVDRSAQQPMINKTASMLSGARTHLLISSPQWYNDGCGFIELKEENADGIKALLATNTGGILYYLEECNELQQIQEWTRYPHSPEKAARNAFVQGASKAVPNKSSVASSFFHQPHFDPNLAALIFDHAGIANEKQAQLAMKVMTKERQR